MLKLEDIKKDAQIRGLQSEELVQVIQVDGYPHVKCGPISAPDFRRLRAHASKAAITLCLG